MKQALLAAAVVTSFVVPSQRAVPDPCRLVTAAQVTSALGSAPSGETPMGPSVDEETGATVSVCVSTVGKVKLSIAVAQFATPDAAEKALTTMADQEAEDGETAKMTEQPGLGQRAIWGATPAGAIWVALKGRYLLNLTLAGELDDGARYREPLKRLATLALAKL
jgi:hypothetical protein